MEKANKSFLKGTFSLFIFGMAGSNVIRRFDGNIIIAELANKLAPGWSVLEYEGFLNH